MAAVWVVDDDASIRWVVEKALAKHQISCQAFASADELISALDRQASPGAILSDIRMPGMSGLQLLEAIRARLPSVPVIIMTAYSDLDSAVAAFQGGAFDYLAKPFDIDAAVELVQRALAQNRPSSEPVTPPLEVAPEMLGQAAAMQEVFRAIGRLSQSSATVLITGESGTGKELVARALHRHSPRSNKPFVALNTAAIPKDLLESELFGHERGAFTGAQGLRKGRFEQAEEGTLFLDEIGDMPLELQTRLLRVLSDGHYYRVGGSQPIKANVRVIAATHQNLELQVERGRFREDLFHRLNVIRLRLPPLRDRPEDITLLANHFLAQSARTMGTEHKTLSHQALQVVQQYPFPGNVRELENLCHWISVMAPGAVVTVADLPPDVKASAKQSSIGAAAEPPALEVRKELSEPPLEVKLSPPSTNSNSSWQAVLEQVLLSELSRQNPDTSEVKSDLYNHLLKEFEVAVIGAALRYTKRRRNDASLRLGIGRNTITRKIAELGLESED